MPERVVIGRGRQRIRDPQAELIIEIMGLTAAAIGQKIGRDGERLEDRPRNRPTAVAAASFLLYFQTLAIVEDRPN